MGGISKNHICPKKTKCAIISGPSKFCMQDTRLGQIVRLCPCQALHNVRTLNMEQIRETPNFSDQNSPLECFHWPTLYTTCPTPRGVASLCRISVLRVFGMLQACRAKLLNLVSPKLQWLKNSCVFKSQNAKSPVSLQNSHKKSPEGEE